MIRPLSQADAGGEVARLARLEAAGVPVAPTWVVELEAEFYALNNLPERVRRAFEGVFGVRIDEDRLEAACLEAQRLVRESYLLPERADALGAAVGEGRFVVRYAGGAPVGIATGRQEVLWHLKRLWASVWEVDAVLARAPRLAPPDRPSLVQRVEALPRPDPDLSRRAAAVLGEAVEVWASAGRVVHVR